MRGLMSDGSLAVGHLILELGEPLLRDPKCLVDGITQVGRLELAKQMTRLMRHHDILVARHGYFNMDHRLSLIHISEPTRQAEISYAVFCLKKKKKKKKK